MHKLDTLDRKIIDELSKNSRQSLRKIAKKLGVAISTVSARIEKLQKADIIKSFTTKLNYDKLGYDLTAVINVRMNHGIFIDENHKIAKLNNACTIYNTAGSNDVLIIGKFRNRGELGEFIKSVQKQEGVDRTHTSLVLESIKENLCWNP